jgi:hypothetical protein
MRRRKQRWKVHECETCGLWTSGGVMVAAGRGRSRQFKWVCDACKLVDDNVLAVGRALRLWEIERGFGVSEG